MYDVEKSQRTPPPSCAQGPARSCGPDLLARWQGHRRARCTLWGRQAAGRRLDPGVRGSSPRTRRGERGIGQAVVLVHLHGRII